ncbi:hypothetical protein HY612_05740 [Candidatus Roizmanbacteria bacterium]|nr:hypothetical protein [Candidatus Roizmanbacteria bacterium]
MNKTYSPLPTIYPDQLAQKGENIYNAVKDRLEKENKGKFMAIEVDSGKYFIGKNQIEVFEKARKKFPKKIFYFIKIGFPADEQAES